jgi:hypothetical protein
MGAQNPTIVGSINTLDSAQAVHVSGSYAFVATYQAGLQVIDISNPHNPYIVGSVDTPDDAYDVFVSDSYAFVTCADSGLQVIDVSDF